jgi:hypothetical protein
MAGEVSTRLAAFATLLAAMDTAGDPLRGKAAA